MASRTIGIWTPGDAEFVDNITNKSAWKGYGINNRPAIVFTCDEVSHYCIFKGIMPQLYSGGDLRLWIHVTSDNVAAGLYVKWYAALDSISAGDAMDTESYGDEKGKKFPAPTSGNTLNDEYTFIPSFVTSAEKDSLQAGDMFNVRIRRDSSDADDTTPGEAYLFAAIMCEVFY